MKRWLKIAGLMVLVAGLSGCCVYRMEELRRAEPTGTPFEKALTAGYRDFVAIEEEEYDWSAAAYFAEKGLLTAYGVDVEPEHPEAWGIQEALSELKKARAQLMKALTRSTKSMWPELAAKAQVSYDSWVEQQHDGWQRLKIKEARDAFNDSMKKISAAREALHKKPKAKVAAKHVKHKAAVKKPAAKKPIAKKSAIKTKPKAVAKPVAAAVEKPAPTAFNPPPIVSETKEAEKASYMVFFTPGTGELSPVSQKIIDAAAESLMALHSYHITIDAGADLPAGADPTLAMARVEAVKERLLVAGIKSSAIDIVAQGGAKSPTPAATPIPVERKVEIFITE